MAHYEKFSKQGVGHIFLHVRRAYTLGKNGQKIYVNFGNRDIDTTRSHLNYNLNKNEDGTPANQKKRYERILAGKTLPLGKELHINDRKDLKIVCGWVVTLPDDVHHGDDRRFFEAVYNFLVAKYPHCISAFCHYDECQHGCENNGCDLKAHMHFLFVPIYYDRKKDMYKISANEVVNRKELRSFHDELSKSVEKELGYRVSIMTGEFSDRENGMRESVDILKYKAEKLSDEYKQLKEKVKNSDEKLVADMADYIVRTGQAKHFLSYQENKDEKETIQER